MRSYASDPSPQFGRRGPGVIGRGVGGVNAIGVAEPLSPGAQQSGAPWNDLLGQAVYTKGTARVCPGLFKRSDIANLSPNSVIFQKYSTYILSSLVALISTRFSAR
jgi:hypothetical protein